MKNHSVILRCIRNSPLTIGLVIELTNFAFLSFMLSGSIVTLFGDGESLGRRLKFYDFYYIFEKSSTALNGNLCLQSAVVHTRFMEYEGKVQRNC